MTLRAKLKQYGVKNSFFRLFKKLIRILGMEWESYFILDKNLTKNYILQPLNGLEVKEIKKVDELKNETFEFTQQKLELFQYRFLHHFHCYGVYSNGQLIYYCWVSTRESDFPNELYEFDLKLNDGIMLDAECHESMREKGIHSWMNKYTCNQLLRLGKNKAFVVILSDNQPALRARLNAGFELLEQVMVLRIKGLQSFVKIKGIRQD